MLREGKMRIDIWMAGGEKEYCRVKFGDRPAGNIYSREGLGVGWDIETGFRGL